MHTGIVPAQLRGFVVVAVCLAGGLAVSPAFAQSGQCPPEARIQSLAQTVNEGLEVSPNGNSSKGTNISYLWTVDSGPGPVTWTPSATAANPKFIAPQVTGDRQMVIRLTVTACGGQTSSTTGTITIKDITAPPSNTAPTAVASANPPIAGEGVTVTLSGSGSTDPENNPLTYTWTQTGGPTVALSSASAAQPTFVTPHLADPAGATLTFKLRVTDPGGLFNETSVVVNVLFANDSPFASLHCPAVVQEGGSVTLDGSASSDYEDDLNNTALKYKWSQLSGPPNIDVGNETGASVTFNAPVLSTGEVGNIEFELTVTDSGNLSTTATCGIFIEDVTAPVFSGDDDRTEEATGPGGANVFYDGLAAIDNVEGDVSDAIVCVPASGFLFGIGPATSVDCAVEDSNHNGRETSFKVLVQDTTKPVIAEQNDIAMEATGPSGRVVTFDAPQTFDVVDVDLVATCEPPSGSTFPLGSTTVDCDATDTAGNAANTESFTVTIHDKTAPDVTVPDDITLEATSPAGAVATFSASATDLVDGSVTTTCVPPSGSTFALGANGVTCSATDAAGNTGTNAFSVIVEDTTAPVLTLPADVTAEATSAEGAIVAFTATASDIVDGSVDVTCAPASGSQFDLGDTTVDCSATDAAGNTANGSFKVTVEDTTPPAITLVPPPSTEANSPAGATVTFGATAIDIVDGDVPVTCVPASGSTFALGTTDVDCSATDAAGNTAIESMQVVVVDTTPPLVTVPADMTEEANIPGGKVVTFATSAFDIVSGSVATTCTPASGSTFALGSHTVDCSATDGTGNTGHASFSITVEDTTAPSLTMPGDITKEATSPAGATATFAPTATDLVDTNVDIVCTPASGSTFALGNTTVNCTATDDSGNSSNGSLHVIVQDTTDPNLHLPANILAEATSGAGAAVSFTVTADDIVDTSVAIVCTPASGSTFAIATTTVNCTATDDSGNDASGSFTVKVQDTTKPVVDGHADIDGYATSNSNAIVNFTRPDAHDIVDGLLATTCTPVPGATFQMGKTTVTCTATDAAGNTGEGKFTVWVKYNFSGFFRPVDNIPVANVVQAGQAIPVKFSLGGNQGMNIFTAGYPKVQVMSCAGNALQEAVEETVTAGNSSLQYDAGNAQYIYVWKTEKSWSGTCRQLQLTFADGKQSVANFTFKK